MILIFWIDDEDFGTDHHRAECLELDGERFTSTRLGEDYHVGIFQAKPVKYNQPVVVHIDAIKDAAVLGEVGRGKRERSGDGASVHVATNLELIHALWHGAVQALFLLRVGHFREDHLLAKNGLDFLLDKLELV